MPSIDKMHPDMRALILNYLPMTTAEQIVHARAALEEARRGVEPLANLYYAERRVRCAALSSRYDVKPAQKEAFARALAALEADIASLRTELSGEDEAAQ